MSFIVIRSGMRTPVLPPRWSPFSLQPWHRRGPCTPNVGQALERCNFDFNIDLHNTAELTSLLVRNTKVRHACRQTPLLSWSYLTFKGFTNPAQLGRFNSTVSMVTCGPHLQRINQVSAGRYRDLVWKEVSQVLVGAGRYRIGRRLLHRRHFAGYLGQPA